jgi:hypothetical protein
MRLVGQPAAKCIFSREGRDGKRGRQAIAEATKATPDEVVEASKCIRNAQKKIRKIEKEAR